MQQAVMYHLIVLTFSFHSMFFPGNMNWLDYSEKQTAEIKARWSSKESLDQLPSTFRGLLII